MKKLILGLLVLALLAPKAFADNAFTWDSGYKGDAPDAEDVQTSTSNFNNNLSSSDTTVQAALDTIDNLTITGDITSVTAGAGLTGGGTSGAVTVTVGAGTAITVNADDVAVTADAIGPTQIDETATYDWTGTHVFDSDALQIDDTGGDHQLIITPGTNLSADRVLTLTTGDSARTVTLSGNPTLSDWFDQGVKTSSTPGFAGLTSTGDVDLDGSNINITLQHTGGAEQGWHVEANDISYFAETSGPIWLIKRTNDSVGIGEPGREVSYFSVNSNGTGDQEVTLPAQSIGVDELTSTLDLSAKTSVSIPAGSNPTTDVAGEIAVDTTTGDGSGLRVYSNVGVTLPLRQSKSFVITNPTSSSDYSIWKTPYNITIREIHVLVTAGTNVVGNLDEADANGANASAIDSDLTALAGVNKNDDGTLSNPTVDADDYLNWHTTSVSGSVTSVTVTFEYTVDQVN